MTCDRPIRDRNGVELPGVRCNLDAEHLGKHAQVDWAHASRPGVSLPA